VRRVEAEELGAEGERQILFLSMISFMASAEEEEWTVTGFSCVFSSVRS